MEYLKRKRYGGKPEARFVRIVTGGCDGISEEKEV